MPRFEEGQNSEWLEEARSVAIGLGRDGRVVTVDDVRERCPPPAGCDPRIMGAVMPRKDWERLGYVQSSRGINHHRPIAQFRLRTA